MTQYDQENDLGGGGGELDDATVADAWRNAEERRSGDEHEPQDEEPAGE
ncbi:MAG TPA: hypothetical protein VM204_00720 [Gaiellaceae bacterium]|nr:hypothetical protein [Gaiellaceae bacterium]